MAKLKITETVLRDAHQSLLATRMSMDDMREILPEIDKIGFYSEVRICLATVTMLMTLLSILYRSLLQMVLISSEFLTH